MTERTYDLYWIAVAPGARGRGIGHALLDRVEDEVRARGACLLVIETSDKAEYAAARGLYTASGYRCEAGIRDFYAPNDGLLIFVKHLDPPSSPLEIVGALETCYPIPANEQQVVMPVSQKATSAGRIGNDSSR